MCLVRFSDLSTSDILATGMRGKDKTSVPSEVVEVGWKDSIASISMIVFGFLGIGVDGGGVAGERGLFEKSW